MSSDSGSSWSEQDQRRKQGKSKNKPLPERQPNALDKLLNKTQLCVFHQRGACRFGKSCNFAHCVSEIRAAPNLRKTMLCKDYFAGFCGDRNCSFAHSQAELQSARKATPCSWHAMGSCRNGINCPFSHTLKPEDAAPQYPPGIGGEDVPVVELEKHLEQQRQPKKNTRQPIHQKAAPQLYSNEYAFGNQFGQLSSDMVPWPQGMQMPMPDGYTANTDEVSSEELVASLVEVLRCSVGLATALNSNKSRREEIDPMQPLKVPLPRLSETDWLLQEDRQPIGLSI